MKNNFTTEFLAKRWLHILGLFLGFVMLSGTAFGQFTLDGSTQNTGSYTCGTSTISQTTGFVDGSSYSITICAAPGEIVYLDLGTIVLNNNGGTGNDDILTVTEGASTLYQDGTGSTGVDNVIVAGTIPGGCLTLTLQCQDDAPQPQVNATINCLIGADAGVDQSPGDCSTTTTLAGNDVSPATGTWTVSPAAGVTITDPNDPTSAVSGMTAGTEYTFTWTSDDGNASHSDDMIFNSAGPGCATYCTPSNTATSYHITNVSFNTINNNSTNGCANMYCDNTGICTSVQQGSTHSLCVTGVVGANPIDCYVYFDWNGDGDFTDSGEEFLIADDQGAGTYCSDITIPCDALTTGSLRMRIYWQRFDGPGTGDACSSNAGSYAEAEDYCINVTADPTPTAVAASTYIACATSATLDATGSSITDGYWTLTAGSGTITDPSAQSTTITGLLNGTTTLQWTSTANCATDTDETTFIVSGLPDATVYAGVDAFTCNDPFALSGSDPSPFTGAWQVISGPNVPGFSDNTSPTTDVTGMVAGTYVLQWDVTTGVCGVVSDQVSITFGGLPPAAAGADQSGDCPTSAVMDATPVDGLTGTWTQVSGPSTAGFVDANDPTTVVFDLVAGSYVFEWTLSGGGCVGTTSDQVTIDISSCVTAITHSVSSDQTYTGCSYTYTDDGGGGNYSSNVNQTTTTFCPDDPDAFATLTFTSGFVGPYDYVVVYDDAGVAAPIVGGLWYDNSGGGSLVSEPGFGVTITSSTGCLYVQSSTSPTNNYSGWEATIGCSSTAGTQNTDFITTNNCGGGGGITVCASGSIPTTSNMDTNPPDLGNLNDGCLGSQEGASNTWVYINIDTDGWLAFDVSPAGGQDFDYAIWGPYDGGYSCPGGSLDEPIRCSWAPNGGACPSNANIGLGVINTTGDAVAVNDVSENGACVPSSNEGWTYPIDATAGQVYVLLFQNYGFNNSTFDFNINDDPNLIPVGESYASLGCDPPQPLPIELMSFTGQNIDRNNHLYWSTASEYLNLSFTIEKSNDGIDWSELTTVPGAGVTNENRYYSTIDYSPYSGITYYRLIQTDFDGKKRSYKTIAIANEIQVDDQFSEIYPNPASDLFFFNYGGRDFNSSIEVNIYNAMGQFITGKTVTEFNGSQSIEIDASELSDGIYQVELIQNDIRVKKKISVVK